mgnify:CR=1 FL=1
MLNLGKSTSKAASICFYKEQTNAIWESSGFKVYYCDNNFLKFLKFCLYNKFSYVFSSHLILNALLGLFRCLNILNTKKLICRESTTVFNRYSGIKLYKYKIAYKLGYFKIDLLITQTDEMRGLLLSSLPYLTKRKIKIVTIPNLFEYPNKRIEPISFEFPYIVTAGRLIYEKGFDILINAFNIFEKKHPKFKLIILGEGEQRSMLETLINELDLKTKVLLPGFSKDVYEYFRGAHLCVVSSRTEGFPNVLLQMMSQNNNIVSTICAGGIQDLKGLFTTQINSDTKLEKTIELCLDSDNSKNRELFDNELNSRNIQSYISKIEYFLDEK